MSESCKHVALSGTHKLHVHVQGMCSFNMLRDTASCPMCSQSFKPVTCAFMDCAWLYDGRKLGPDGAVASCSSEWQVGPAVSISEGCLMELLSASGIAELMNESSHQSMLIGNIQQGRDQARFGLCLTNTSDREGLCLLHNCFHV